MKPKKTAANAKPGTKGAATDGLSLLGLTRPLTGAEDRLLASACRQALTAYRRAVARDDITKDLAARARSALLHLGGDPDRSTASLKDYDHGRFGPFLGVSDEGSAAGAIREAAFASPKGRALKTRTPLTVGVAVDAERLGGIGEIAVGPEEYADIWLACVDRVLVTTNVGTRVNLRVYRREPRIVLDGGDKKSIAKAKKEIAAAFKPFVETPDHAPRPLMVAVELPHGAAIDTASAALAALAAFVSSGAAAGAKRAPKGHELGLAVRVGWGPDGKLAAIAALDLAAGAGVRTVVLDGVKRKEADEAISYAGLLDYFAPGIVGPILRHAKKNGVEVRAANLPDADTIARGIWATLITARSMGVNLGKYGCFPLVFADIEQVVTEVQRWLVGWSAAPVFFVDQGLLADDAVYVGKDIVRGIERWLDSVHVRGARVVLIDTIDKAKAGKLLKRDGKDKTGYLGSKQIERLEAFAKQRGIKVLWAGGLGLRDAYQMGKIGVFGIYVTSAAATSIPVRGIYVRDPALAGVKEPQKEAVLRTKIMLEAGFLAGALAGPTRRTIAAAAEQLLSALDRGRADAIASTTDALAELCVEGWREHWHANRTKA